MSDELPSDLRPIADFFGLRGTEPVAKDFAVVRAIGALAALDAAPFTLVFGALTSNRLMSRIEQMILVAQFD